MQVPVIVPITPRLRLVEDDRDFTSLGEVYDRDRYQRGMDPEAPLLLYRERCGDAAKRVKLEVQGMAPSIRAQAQQQGQQFELAEKRVHDSKLREASLREKQSVFKEVCDTMVPQDLLKKYLITTLGDPEALWAFQANFATQLAMSNLLFYIFQCPQDRAPHKVVFHKTTARVFAVDLRMQLAQPSQTPDADIPIRLTRNIVHALSPFLIEGTFVTTLSVVANALFAKKEVLLPFIHLMLRDELVGMQANKQGYMIKTEGEQRQIERTVCQPQRMNMMVNRFVAAIKHVCPELNPSQVSRL